MMPEVKKTILPLPPFQCDAQGKYTFAPYGRFGARYFVGDEAAYKSLKPLRLWRIVLISMLLPLVVDAAAQGIGDAEIIQQATPLLFGITILIVYVSQVNNIAATLTVEEPRANFVHIFRDLAYQADTALLWGVQVVCLAVVYFFAMTLHHPWGPQTLLNALYTAIFATVAAVCALMLAIGSRRVAVRR